VLWVASSVVAVVVVVVGVIHALYMTDRRYDYTAFGQILVVRLLLVVPCIQPSLLLLLLLLFHPTKTAKPSHRDEEDHLVLHYHQ
jgi:putative copper export protein